MAMAEEGRWESEIWKLSTSASGVGSRETWSMKVLAGPHFSFLHNGSQGETLSNKLTSHEHLACQCFIQKQWLSYGPLNPHLELATPAWVDSLSLKAILPKTFLFWVAFVHLVQNLDQFSNPSQERKLLKRGILLRVPLECKTFN